MIWQKHHGLYINHIDHLKKEKIKPFLCIPFIKQLSHCFTRAQTQRCHFKAEHIKNGSGMSWYKLPQSSALTVIKFDHQEKQGKGHIYILITLSFTCNLCHSQGPQHFKIGYVVVKFVYNVKCSRNCNIHFEMNLSMVKGCVCEMHVTG